MNNPNFLVIGAQKCGTTSLCTLLGHHPEIFMCHPKEPHYFAKDEIYAKGWDWYASLFEASGDARAVGEGSTGYTLHTVFPKAPARIARDLPDARLIYMVRDPLERIESAWMQRRGDGIPVWDLGRTLRRYPRMVDASRYWKQLNYYRYYFPDNRIKVVFFEDFKQAPDAVLKTCFQFLDIDTDVTIQHDRVENASIGKKAESLFSVWARHNPGARKLGRLFPKTLRTRFRRLGRKELTERPQWDAESLEWVLYEIGADTEHFLHYADRPGDFWDLGLHRLDTG